MEYKPEDDGRTHVNIYSKSRTSTGRFLSNFAYAPFSCQDGDFDSVEGYWHWLSIPESEPLRDKLRHASGYTAKKLGRELRRHAGKTVYRPDFETRIRLAIRAKFERYPERIDKNLATLPLAHYYIYDGRIVNVGHKFDWFVNVVADEMRAICH